MTTTATTAYPFTSVYPTIPRQGLLRLGGDQVVTEIVDTVTGDLVSSEPSADYGARPWLPLSVRDLLTAGGRS